MFGLYSSRQFLELGLFPHFILAYRATAQNMTLARTKQAVYSSPQLSVRSHPH